MLSWHEYSSCFMLQKGIRLEHSNERMLSRNFCSWTQYRFGMWSLSKLRMDYESSEMFKGRMKSRVISVRVDFNRYSQQICHWSMEGRDWKTKLNHRVERVKDKISWLQSDLLSHSAVPRPTNWMLSWILKQKFSYIGEYLNSWK